MNLNLSIKKICSILNADFVDTNNSFKTTTINNVVIDSRSPLINSHTLFVLLTGAKTNGEIFIPEFIKKGGGVVLTNHKIATLNIAQVIVKNPLHGLQLLAKNHRNKFTIPVIGITGSNGKTTVKEWLYYVLKDSFSIVRSPKSYNSQIGVALSVLEMDNKHELAIFEAGISQPNEMANLTEMIQPTIGVFTGIGDAHNTGFRAFKNPLEKKREEKYILFKNTEALFEMVDDFIHINKNGIKAKLPIVIKNNAFYIEDGKTPNWYTAPYSNYGLLNNAALVCAVSSHLGIKNQHIKNKIKTLPPISMRLEKLQGKNHNLLINDAYNLDQKSLEIGLQFLTNNKGNKKTVVFIAENSTEINSSTTLLIALNNIREKIHIDRVFYFGKKELSEKFDWVEKQFESVKDFMDNPIEISNSAILFTGSRSCHLEKMVNVFLEKKHVTRLFISLNAIRNNKGVFRSRLNATTKILAMVKAQSYGGGIVEIAEFLEQEEIDYFGVAYADEGVTLRKAGITKPIMVMNPEPAAFDDLLDYELEPSIYSLSLLNQFIHQLILRQKTNYPIHIKLDTGMNRLGLKKQNIKELTETLAVQPEVYVKSVFSHLSVADTKKETEFTQNQISEFTKQTALIAKEIGYSFIRHLANSAGAYYYPNAQFDMVRLGIGLYGLLEDTPENDSKTTEFENVFQFATEISQIKKLKKGDSVGYGRAFIAKTNTLIGIIPVGYADGLRRSLGNQNWYVLIKGKRYPIIGNICMDMCMVDLGIDEFKEGDEVQLFGSENSIFEMSKILNTIPYEIISSISARVQRVYIED